MKLRSIVWWCVVSFAVVFLACVGAPILGQVSSGSFSGNLVDAQGAVAANVDVKLINKANNQVSMP